MISQEEDVDHHVTLKMMIIIKKRDHKGEEDVVHVIMTTKMRKWIWIMIMKERDVQEE